MRNRIAVIAATLSVFGPYGGTNAQESPSPSPSGTAQYIAPRVSDYRSWGPVSRDGLEFSMAGPTLVHLAKIRLSMNARSMLSFYRAAPYFFLANYLPGVRNVGTNTVKVCTRLLDSIPKLFDEQNRLVEPTGSMNGEKDNWSDNFPVVGPVKPGETVIADPSGFAYLDVRYPDLTPGNYTLVENIDVGIRSGSKCRITMLHSAPLSISVVP